jgi:hypothetical protein
MNIPTVTGSVALPSETLHAALFPHLLSEHRIAIHKRIFWGQVLGVAEGVVAVHYSLAVTIPGSRVAEEVHLRSSRIVLDLAIFGSL